MTLESRMRSFRFLDQELRDVSTALRAYCRKQYKKDYNLLRSILGIGGIVACGILCELGDLRRFGNVKQLAGYVGLAPGVHQSGGTYKTMGMTMRAHRLIRSYFVEAAWQAVRTDPVMQGYYRKHLGKDTKEDHYKSGPETAQQDLGRDQDGNSLSDRGNQLIQRNNHNKAQMEIKPEPQNNVSDLPICGITYL